MLPAPKSRLTDGRRPSTPALRLPCSACLLIAEALAVRYSRKTVAASCPCRARSPPLRESLQSLRSTRIAPFRRTVAASRPCRPRSTVPLAEPVSNVGRSPSMEYPLLRALPERCPLERQLWRATVKTRLPTTGTRTWRRQERLEGSNRISLEGE